LQALAAEVVLEPLAQPGDRFYASVPSLAGLRILEIGFAFPKEERAALVAARPDVFLLPRESELRFHWIEAWLDALDADEMRELVLEAWRMVVPQRVAREVLGPPVAGHEPGPTG
jgi:hypothetical protein